MVEMVVLRFLFAVAIMAFDWNMPLEIAIGDDGDHDFTSIHCNAMNTVMH